MSLVVMKVDCLRSEGRVVEEESRDEFAQVVTAFGMDVFLSLYCHLLSFFVIMSSIFCHLILSLQSFNLLVVIMLPFCFEHFLNLSQCRPYARWRPLLAPVWPSN